MLPSLLQNLYQQLPPDTLLTSPEEMAPYLTDWRQQFSASATFAVAQPRLPSEVKEIVTQCHRFGIPITPQGGNTSLCGASIPSHSHSPSLLLSFKRLNQIKSIDLNNNTLTVQAGCTLEQVKSYAAQHNRLFPLDIAVPKQCLIGGNLATNAGGINVLRYGNMRDLTLGIEVILADGNLLSLMNALRKDNHGYALKDLFIGSEGTLGIFTSAILKLFPKPNHHLLALVSLPCLDTALMLFHQLKTTFFERLSAYEVFSQRCLALVQQYCLKSELKFATTAPWYGLIEISGHAADCDHPPLQALQNLLQKYNLSPLQITDDPEEMASIWFLRKQIAPAQKEHGRSIKHDISVPLSQLPAFVAQANPAIQKKFPQCTFVIFGHFGDGNLHYNVFMPQLEAADAFHAISQQVNQIVYPLVRKMGGSIAAEHGIGQLKVDSLASHYSPIEHQIMTQIKQSLDPLNLMNPGKLFHHRDILKSSMLSQEG